MTPGLYSSLDERRGSGQTSFPTVPCVSSASEALAIYE
jgi:hypothetical protein